MIIGKIYTQEELANITGLKRQSISRIEKFSVSPTLGTVETIAGALGMRIRLEKVKSNDNGRYSKTSTLV